MNDHSFAADLMKLRPTLIRNARKLGARPGDAEDYASDAILRAWAARDRFQPGTSLAAWLFVIERNLILTDQRRARFNGGSVEALGVEPPATGGGQEARIILLETERELSRMPRDMARSVVLSALNSYDDAAAIDGVCAGTMKSRASRGRERLRAAA